MNKLIRLRKSNHEEDHLAFACRSAGGLRQIRTNRDEHMTHLVQQLLLLAEASEVQIYSFAPVDVLDVAQEVVRYLQRMALVANVRIELMLSENGRPTWQADHSALFTLLKNLLENPIQHAPCETAVNLIVETKALTVRDWGNGVDEEQLPQIFLRFWRGLHRCDQGTGLGLAICEEIARTHGWTPSAQRVEPGSRGVLEIDTPLMSLS